MQTIFALCYRPGPAWLPGKSVFEQPLSEHRSYMQSLIEAGTIVLGGPYRDDTGGLVAVDAGSRAAALDILTRDPAIEAGIMVAEVHPWLILGGRAATFSKGRDD
jgi:uncharacterized protein YciI